MQCKAYTHFAHSLLRGRRSSLRGGEMHASKPFMGDITVIQYQVMYYIRIMTRSKKEMNQGALAVLGPNFGVLIRVQY